MFYIETYPKNTLFGSIAVTVGSGVYIKLPSGGVGVKPSNEIITCVLPFDALFLLLKARPVIHGTLLSVTLQKQDIISLKGLGPYFKCYLI